MSKNKKFINSFKIVLKHLVPYKKDLIIISVLGVVSAVVNAVVPYIAGRLIDAILSQGKIFQIRDIKIPLWLLIIILWLIVKLISDVIDWVINLKNIKMEEIIHSDYIVNGFGVLLELPLSFHKEKKMGEVADKINRAADWLYRIVCDVIISLAPQFLSVIMALVISFWVNYLLTFVLIFGVLIYVGILVRVAPSMATLQRKSNRAYNKAFGAAYDVVVNAQPVKQSVSEKYEQNKIFKNFRLKASKIWAQMMSIWQGMSFYQRLIISITQFVIYVISIFLIYQNKMTLGELVMFNGYAAMFFGPFAKLGHNWQVFQNGLIAVERGDKILSVPKEIYTPEKAPVLSDIKGEIEFKDVFFAYKNGKPVLEGINLKVSPGEIIALVGESGMGKSTLVDLISAYYFPASGKVLIDGHNTKNLDLKFLRSKISVVPQEVILFNDTIEVNIKYGSFGASLKKVQEAAQKAYALEFIEKFPKKWKQIVGERGVKLSGGQKQRVAIARAILRNPKILILDEPTSALDAKSESIIRKSLEELMKGKTTFIIAHRLSTVRKADKILVLDKGKIAEMGTHEELMKIKSGIYRKLYELQIGITD